MLKRNHIIAIISLIGVALICFFSGKEFLEMREPVKLYPSSGITRIGMLSDYFDGIKGTNGDTEVYFFEGAEPGATIFIIGGAHPNEPAGYLAAVVLVENINVHTGRVIVIPQACNSGFSCTDPMEGYPQFYWLTTKSGPRKFRFGSRISNPVDQWPDPLVYSHHPSGQSLSGFETRNLNRSYPGRPDGTFTEQVAYAIVQLIKEEKVDVAFDLHEAAPEIPIINAIVYHEKSEDIAMNAILNLEFEDLSYAPELSPENFHGLSHREWGDYTEAFPFLFETSNVIQGRLRGKTNSDLIIKGKSEQYKKAQETGALRIVYEPTGQPLSLRVGRHIQAFISVLEAYNEYFPDKSIVFSDIPTYSEMMENRIGNYLH